MRPEIIDMAWLPSAFAKVSSLSNLLELDIDYVLSQETRDSLEDDGVRGTSKVPQGTGVGL